MGGASAVTAWVLQALCDDFDVHLATPDREVDFGRLDVLYGTSLAQADIRVHELSLPEWLNRVPAGKLKSLRLAASFQPQALTGLRGGLIFNTANEMSFHGRAVNYIHCPIRHPQIVSELYKVPQRWMRLANNAAFKAVSRFDEQHFRQARCIANGTWTAAALLRAYNIKAQIVHPPVAITARRRRPITERAAGFVCVGRITKDKRTLDAIDVIDALRRRGHDVHLHIVGSGEGRYARAVEAAAHQRPYVAVERAPDRIQLAEIFTGHRFGLHMMRNEHFGMAVAEMTALGMLVLAHRSAGPLEILGQESPLLFDDTSQAISIASTLLKSATRQKELAAELAEQDLAQTYSPDAFMNSIRRVVQEALH
ncbi:MAG TPA: glycosyltransferase family 4 protein [Streptosporangiaceae bacterium]|nr:glycosyltransferase family 4 protein [Streptosporangiaceae bacterium]